MSQSSYAFLFSKSAIELLDCQVELRAVANALAKYGFHEAASTTLKLLSRLRLLGQAETELARLRDLLTSAGHSTPVPRLGPGDLVLIGQGSHAGQLAQVVLVRRGTLSGIVYDVRTQRGFIQGLPDDWLCSSIEEYAALAPLDSD